MEEEEQLGSEASILSCGLADGQQTERKCPQIQVLSGTGHDGINSSAFINGALSVGSASH